MFFSFFASVQTLDFATLLMPVSSRHWWPYFSQLYCNTSKLSDFIYPSHQCYSRVTLGVTASSQKDFFYLKSCHGLCK